VQFKVARHEQVRYRQRAINNNSSLVTGAPYKKLQSVTQLDTMVKSTMTETVPSSGRGGDGSKT